MFDSEMFFKMRFYWGNSFYREKFSILTGIVFFSSVDSVLNNFPMKIEWVLEARLK
jgi:hypothetical protein